MFKFLSTLAIALFTIYPSFSFSKSCNELAVNSNWPLDRIKLVISCDIVGPPSQYIGSDSACVFITEDQISNYSTTTYHFNFYRSGKGIISETPLITSTPSTGTKNYRSNGTIKLNPNEVSYFEDEFHPNDLILKNAINLENPDELKLKILEKKFIGKRTVEESTYRCVKL